MTPFDHPDAVIAALQTDAGLTRRVDLLVQQRFNLTPARYRALFWVLLAEAACAGGRITIAELQQDATKETKA